MSIFVSIPSYRDPECLLTVKDLFSKADNADIIFVGICSQVDPTEDNDCSLQDIPRPNQVRIHTKDCREARGPCLARSITQSLWKDEEYYLQIDSHMRFIKGWDTILKQYLSQTKNPDKSIITSYPVGYEQPNLVPTYKNAAFMVAKGFAEDGMLRLEGKLLRQCLNKPTEGCFWVSGFAFSSSKVIQEVPYDPTLEYLFFGEEMLMAARLWTHGWDFYATGKSILRVWNILQMPVPDNFTLPPDYVSTTTDKYGLGSARTLEEYSKFSGVDFLTRKIDSRARLGGLQEKDFMDAIMELVMKSSPMLPLPDK